MRRHVFLLASRSRGLFEHRDARSPRHCRLSIFRPDTRPTSTVTSVSVLVARDRFAGERLLSFCLAPHAPYTASDATFQRVLSFAEELGIGVHTHLHETANEVTDALAKSGERPIARLARLGVLGPTSCRTLRSPQPSRHHRTGTTRSPWCIARPRISSSPAASPQWPISSGCRRQRRPRYRRCRQQQPARHLRRCGSPRSLERSFAVTRRPSITQRRSRWRHWEARAQSARRARGLNRGGQVRRSDRRCSVFPRHDAPV